MDFGVVLQTTPPAARVIDLAKKAEQMAGGKVAKVSRVEWVTMPDAQTAINAIISGEVDYLEQVQIDLMPILTSSPDVVVETRDPLGFQAMARMNFKYPPFDNVKVRRAAMMALSQRDILTALVNNPDYFKLCGAIFGCATPYADESGTSILVPGGDKAAARTLLKESGYDGTPIVLLQPTDVITLKTQPIVAAQALREGRAVRARRTRRRACALTTDEDAAGEGARAGADGVCTGPDPGIAATGPIDRAAGRKPITGRSETGRPDVRCDA